jgi:putative oxygen-independent coproporphyrinogen III oxidase
MTRSSRSDPPASVAPLGIYLHFPFCAIRCSYCDFPTVAGRDDRIEAYLTALDREIRTMQPDLPRGADTVFFGGGTPSRMSPAQVGRVLEAVRARFDLSPEAEITLEGNPESLTAESLHGFRAAGITRVSVGVQSLDDAVLARAGRAHDAAGAERAVREARGAGLPRGLARSHPRPPRGAPRSLGETVRRAAGFGADHVSVYLLESDKETPLGRAVRSGRAALAGDDALAAAYEETVAALEGEGFALYEISNFARDGRRSRHNLKYWTDAPFAGFGNGAHGYVQGRRRANLRDLAPYLEAVAGGREPVAWEEGFEARRRLAEALFLGLRVLEGVDLAALASRYGEDPKTVWAEAWARGEEAGLVVLNGDRARLTREGRLRSNELFQELV